MATNYRRIWSYYNHDANNIPEYYGMGTTAPYVYNSGWIRYARYLVEDWLNKGFQCFHIHNPFGRGGLGSRSPNVYNPNVAYASGQIVRNTYGQEYYSKSKVNNNLGNTPVNGGSNSFWEQSFSLGTAYLYNSGTTYCTGCTLSLPNGSSYISLQNNNSGNPVSNTNFWAPFDSVNDMIFDVVPRRYEYGDTFLLNNFVTAWRSYAKSRPIKAYVGTQHNNTRFSNLLNNSPPNFTAYDTRMHNSMQLLIAANMHITFDAAIGTTSGQPFNNYMRYLKNLGISVGIEPIYPTSYTHLDGYDIFLPGQTIQSWRDNIINGTYRATGFVGEVVVGLDYEPNYGKIYSGNWAVSTLYRGTGNLLTGTGNAVLNNGTYYFCTSGHTSSASNEPGVGIAASSVWATGYFDYVAYNGTYTGTQATGYMREWIRNMFINGFSVAIGPSIFTPSNPVTEFVPTGWLYNNSSFGYVASTGSVILDP